ncbi:hypothetical protein CRG98_016980 [Punica granatum]|uniref:Uncharacterized protein n=1 Tax=Punica granatum TaxID=22663 RepID=A0A2I0K248_PUNGR|nr:hypothetical protein CRG98_016980 [Punica granatum]
MYDQSRPELSPGFSSSADCTGRPDNSGNKRPPRSPRGVPWLPKAADLASKVHREPPWRHPTRLVPVGSVQYSSRVCLVPFGSVQRKTAQTRPINGPTRFLKVPSRISGRGMTIPDLEELGLLHSRCVYGVIRGFIMSGNTWIVVEKNIPTREGKELTGFPPREHARNDSNRDGETSWNPIGPWDLLAISKEK